MALPSDRPSIPSLTTAFPIDILQGCTITALATPALQALLLMSLTSFQHTSLESDSHDDPELTRSQTSNLQHIGIALDLRCEVDRMGKWIDRIKPIDIVVFGSSNTTGSITEIDSHIGTLVSTLLNLLIQISEMSALVRNQEDFSQFRDEVQYLLQAISFASLSDKPLAGFVMPQIDMRQPGTTELSIALDLVSSFIDCLPSLGMGLELRHTAEQYNVDLDKIKTSQDYTKLQTLRTNEVLMSEYQDEGKPKDITRQFYELMQNPQFHLETFLETKPARDYVEAQGASIIPGTTVSYFGAPPPYSADDPYNSSRGHRKKGQDDIKATWIGDGATGKTCSIIAHTKGTFPEIYVPTVCEHYSYSHETSASGSISQPVETLIEDTAGQEDYDRLRPLSYPDTNVLVITFAIDSPDSLYNVVGKWLSEASYFCGSTPFLLVGLKADLRTDPRTIAELAKVSQAPVTYEQGQGVAALIGAKAYIECSAKTQSNLYDVFNTMVAYGWDAKRKGIQATKGRQAAKSRQAESSGLKGLMAKMSLRG